MATWLENYSCHLITLYGFDSTVQNQDFTHLRNRAAQLESELDNTKTQLGTEHFDRKVCFCIVLPAANWGEMQYSTKAN